MLKTLFGDAATGRLARLPYLGYWFLLGLLGIVIAIGIGASIGVAEQAIGGDIQQAQAHLRENLGLPAISFIFAVGILLLFGNLNLMAKRIRDMGLPGWWVVLGFVVLNAIISTGILRSRAEGRGHTPPRNNQGRRRIIGQCVEARETRRTFCWYATA